MAKLRKGAAYRSVERPYARKSKYRNKNFVRAVPNNRIVSYDMGNLKKEFGYTIHLIAKNPVQLRHNSIESARQSSNRVLEKNLGKASYHLKIRMYPHHILRENPLASGAGADRMSTGMKKSFGKPIGLAARIKEGQKLFSVSCAKSNIAVAKTALTRASHKLPCSCVIDVVENSKK